MHLKKIHHVFCHTKVLRLKCTSERMHSNTKKQRLDRLEQDSFKLLNHEKQHVWKDHREHAEVHLSNTGASRRNSIRTKSSQKCHLLEVPSKTRPSCYPHAQDETAVESLSQHRDMYPAPYKYQMHDWYYNQWVESEQSSSIPMHTHWAREPDQGCVCWNICPKVPTCKTQATIWKASCSTAPITK